MTKIAILVAAAVVAIAGPASAGWNNGLSANGLSTNDIQLNGLSTNDVQLNGIGANAVIAHSPPSEFCGQGKGDTVIAHSPPSEFCAQGIPQPVGLGLGGTDGMKVMTIELPR